MSEETEPLAALRVYDRLIRSGTATASTWRGAADALLGIGEDAQAARAYQRCVVLDPADRSTHHNLAVAWYHLGEIERTVDHLRRATTDGGDIQSWVALATVIPSCPSVSAEEILRIRRETAGRLAEATGWAVPSARGRPRTSRSRTTRVGYLSASFHDPAYMKPVWGLLNAHDRGQLEIHLFSDAPADAPLPGYEPHPTDRLHVTRKMTNEELVALVREAGVDLLVDLNGYGAPARLPIFLSRPAPVTVTWFNAYATSGFPGVDWIVGDRVVVAAGEDRFFSEQVAATDACTLTFAVQHPAPEVSPPPCVSEGFVTFGSLASQYKINPTVLDLWAEILRRSLRARLVIANRSLGSPGNRAHLLDALAARGIPEERVTLRGPAPHLDFLRIYDEMDVALDTFPYSGGTTTMEALWQGVPVLTFRGDRWAARTTETLLSYAGLSEYVSADRDALVEAAVALAGAVDTPSRLAALRHGLRRRLRRAAVCDTPAMAAAMEGLYARLLARVGPDGG